MKTYTELKQQKPFNWDKVLDKAIQKQPSEAKRRELSDLAAAWVTCACGNQCSIIPRNEEGEPEDERLAILGCCFSDNIDFNMWDEAKRTLKKIEKRAAVLIAKENEKISKLFDNF